MKKGYLILIYLLLIIGFSKGQTSLSAGDLAIIGLDTPNEDFSFVAFVDLEEGTEIYFTDEEAVGDYTIGTGEGTVLFTAPTGGITAGTVITYQGDISYFTTTSDGALGLADSGDGLLAYQGSSVGNVTTFLHAVGEDMGFIGTFPDGFNNYMTYGADDGQFGGLRMGSATELMADINNSSLWETSGSGVLPFNTTLFTILASDIRILTFEFEGLDGDEETAISNFNESNLQSTDISRSIKLTPTSSEDQFAATSWGDVDIQTSVDDGRYMEFEIQPNAGYQFTVNHIYIRVKRSLSGTRGIAIRSSLDNFANNLDQEYAIADNEDAQEFLFSFSQTSMRSITYRIYMHAESNSGKGGIGGDIGNDIIVFGSVDQITPSDQIIIARNCDPDDNFEADRYAEIYNAGGADLDITGWTLENIQNNSVAFSWTFSGSIAAGETWVCARADATDQTISPDVTATWSGDSWNGKDGDGTILKDDLGNIKDNAVQSGTTNKFEDKQMKRKLDVILSNSSFDPNEWVFTSLTNANDLLPGEHGTVWANKNPNWGTDGNWDNLVPTETADAFIVAGADIPNLNVEGVCRNLTIKPGALLTVPAGKTLSVNGTLTNEAGINGLVLESDASGPSSLLHQTDGVPASVESYFIDLNEYYLVSSPISNATANVFFGDYLAYWDEVTGNWMNIYDETTALAIGGGYSLKKVNDHTATYQGLLNNGEETVSGLTRTSGDYAGWNLLGNPYPSVLDADGLSYSNLDASVSVYPHSGSSGYLAYSLGTGGSDEARYIQPGQGFMVRVSEGQTSGSLTFTNDARTHTGLGLFDKTHQTRASQNHSLLKIEITGASTTKDEAYIGFREGATHYFDSYYDVRKLFGASVNPHVFSYINLEEDEQAAINAIPSPSEGDVIHLGTKIGLAGDYELKFSGLSSFESQYEFLLRDKKTDQLYQLELDSLISFSYENGDPINRFDLYFDLSTQTDALKEEVQNPYSVYSSNDRIIIQSEKLAETTTTAYVYNMLGQLVAEKTLTGHLEIIEVESPFAYYLVHIKNNEEEYHFKTLIK
jgi:hypothetical protein